MTEDTKTKIWFSILLFFFSFVVFTAVDVTLASLFTDKIDFVRIIMYSFSNCVMIYIGACIGWTNCEYLYINSRK